MFIKKILLFYKKKYNKRNYIFAVSIFFLILSVITNFFSISLFPSAYFLKLDISDLFIIIILFVFRNWSSFVYSIMIGIIKCLFIWLLKPSDGFWVGHVLEIINTLFLILITYLYVTVIKVLFLNREVIIKKNSYQKIIIIFSNIFYVFYIVCLMTSFNIAMNESWVINSYVKLIGFVTKKSIFYKIIWFYIFFNLIKYFLISCVVFFLN